MKRQLPPLNALRAFETAGRHQSFSRAAEELGVSHSSISRHVRGLEDRLGVPLFRDVSRGIELSREGATYLTEISLALDAIAEATEALIETPKGTVTVNSDPMFAHRWLVPRLTSFLKDNPHVDIRVETSSRVVDVNRYEADLAIRFVSPGRMYAGAELLTDAPLFPYASPELIAGPIDDPRTLLRHRLLRDRNNFTWPTWFAKAGVDAADIPQTRWRMGAQMAAAAAIAGQGVLLTSADIVAKDVDEGRLIQVSPIGFQEGSMQLVSRDGALRLKSVRMFRDWLVANTAPWRGMWDG